MAISLSYITPSRWQVLAIDEAQFFGDLVPFCIEAAEGRGQRVIVAGLDGDFLRSKFGQVRAHNCGVLLGSAGVGKAPRSDHQATRFGSTVSNGRTMLDSVMTDEEVWDTAVGSGAAGGQCDQAHVAVR